jgi:tetratricopeptide (TPR) repeat protein
LVAAELKVDANDGELEIIKKRQARFAAASDEQFRGRFYLNNRTKENIDKAIAAFTNATNIDPSYALAWAGLAEAYVSKSLPSYGSLTPREAKLKALDAANTALQLDADLCEAHTAMGLIQMRYDWDSAAAEKSFKRAIEINPDYAPAHYGYSYALVLLAKPDKALAEAQRARDLAPLARNFESNVARMYYFNREPLTAIPMLTKMLAEKPDENNVAYLLGLLYLEAGQYEDARVLYEKYYPTDKVYFAAQLGYAYGRLNRKTDAMRVMAELETRAKTETVPAQESAIIYLGLGDIDKAFELFDKSCNDRYPALPFILNEFFFDPYRTDRRYAELTACITPLS